MKIAIRYYTKTGNTKKLAEAIGSAINVEAKTVDEPLTEDIDILFLGSAVYAAGIDQKIKDFVDSQLKIGDASVSAITSGMGLHPSLSNIMVNGKLASGSELLYAFKLYLHTDLEIPTSIILEPINQAIAFNFPHKNIKLGFYHQSIQSEEALSSSQRLKNS
jgi:hypothetical protein